MCRSQFRILIPVSVILALVSAATHGGEGQPTGDMPKGEVKKTRSITARFSREPCATTGSTFPNSTIQPRRPASTSIKMAFSTSAGGFRRPDPQEGNADHDRRLRHTRTSESALRKWRWTASIAASNTTASVATTLGSCSKNSYPKLNRRQPGTAGPSSSQRRATTVPSAAPAAARSARSPPRGNARIHSTVSSVLSEPTSVSAVATCIPP